MAESQAAGGDKRATPLTDRPYSKTQLFCSNLPWSVNGKMLRQAFEEHGEVIDAFVAYNGRSSRGFGYVTFKNGVDASAALKAQQEGKSLHLGDEDADRAREIRVELARERPGPRPEPRERREGDRPQRGEGERSDRPPQRSQRDGGDGRGDAGDVTGRGGRGRGRGARGDADADGRGDGRSRRPRSARGRGKPEVASESNSESGGRGGGKLIDISEGAESTSGPSVIEESSES